MISDVLFDLETSLEEAEQDISEYLEDDNTKGCYQDRDILIEITDVLARVRSLRRKLDSPLTPEEEAARKPANPNP